MKLENYPVQTSTFVPWFNRLITLRPKELLITDTTRFEPCATFKGGECDCGVPAEFGPHWDGKVAWTDLEIWFPCDDPNHIDCGFFRWVITLETLEYRLLEKSQAPDEPDENYVEIFDKLVSDTWLKEDKLIVYAKEWITEWVHELREIPIRYVDFEERKSRFAKYEEFHPHQEAQDIIALCERRVVEMENNPENVVRFESAEDFMDYLKNLKDDDDDNDYV